MPAKRFPRACPCPEKGCQKEWAELTKTEEEDDDPDFIVEHCECHDISYGKTSCHCVACGIWVCQNCAFLIELPEGIADEDGALEPDDGIHCGSCHSKWVERVRLELNERLNSSRTELRIFQEAFGGSPYK